jgi:hypothetical protein
VRALGAALDSVPGLTPEELRPHRAAAASLAAFLLEEMGFAELGVHLEVARSPNQGVWAAMWRSVSPAAAMAGLVLRVCERVMGWAARDPLARYELQAAQWVFCGHAGPRGGGVDDALRARITREMEWLLVDRPILAYGNVPAARAFVARPRCGDLPVGQRELAQALARSRAGIYAVRARTEAVVELWDLTRREACAMLEHNPRHDYGPGAYYLGRLLPTAGGRWRRSPGGVVWRVDDGAAADAAVARTVSYAVERADEGLAIEAHLRACHNQTPVPDYEPPAASPREARAHVDQFWRLVRASGMPDAAGNVELHWVVAFWLKALEEQARGN